MTLDVDGLLAACADEGTDAGITIRVEYEPLAGPGAPIKPPTYPGERQGDPPRFQIDRRWWGNGDERLPVEVVVVDNVPSQANRYEAALAGLRDELGLPEVLLDLSSVAGLPPHLPRELSGFRFPHRNADAYLRDSMLDGTSFPNTEVGKAIFAATPDAPSALLQWFPQALLYGFWQSHLGKKRSQAKLARSWVSEIAGYEPASTESSTLGVKGDPLNLSVDESAQYDEEDLLSESWALIQGSSKGAAKGTKKERLSEIGHGQVPISASAPMGVSCSAIVQRSTLSFPGLRRIHFDGAEASAAARAVLAALGIVAHVEAFGRPFTLRSGCDLRQGMNGSATWTWLGAADDRMLDPPSRESAIALFRACVDRAERVGLPVGSLWPAEPLVLEPGEHLAAAIRASWPLED